MPISVIWIDQDIAKVFQISDEKMERKTFQAHQALHHTHSLDHKDQARKETPFFTEVSTAIGASDQILILGPGMAKHHFQNFLIEHSPLKGKKIVGCETVDHPTDAQIAALAKKFFKIEAPRQHA